MYGGQDADTRTHHVRLNPQNALKHSRVNHLCIQGEDVYTGAKLAMAELLKSGCTTTSDHLYVFPNDVRS